MKKRFTARKKILLIFSCLSIFLLIYFNTNSYIGGILWKANSLNKISDELNFKDNLRIEGKKIFFKDAKCGFILICLHKYLIVTNNRGQWCVYSNKGEINGSVSD